jgi:tetratricopeptide (TPR) repeat protein
VDPPAPLVSVSPRSELDVDRIHAAALFTEARILLRRDRLAEALRRYQRAYHYDPDAAVILREIVALSLGLDRNAEAARYAVLLAETHLVDAMMASQLAMLLTEQMDYENALRLYERAVRRARDGDDETGDVLVRFEMGRLYFLTGQYVQAADSFQWVRQALNNPQRFPLDEAVRQALLSRPEITYSLMAECFLEAGRTDAAAELFQRAALDGAPTGLLALQLARVDLQAGQTAAARDKLQTYFDQRLSVAGSEPYAMLRTILAAGKEGVQPAAGPELLDELRRLQRQDPTNNPLRLFVAQLHRELGQYEEAAGLYRKLLAQQATPESYRGLIDAYRTMNQPEQLLDVLGRAVVHVQGLELLQPEVGLIGDDGPLLDKLLAIARARVAAGKTMGEGVAGALGMLAVTAGRFQVSDEFFNQAVREAKPYWELYVNWGLDLLLADEYSRSAQVLRKVLDAQLAGDQEAAFYYYLAGALQLSGQTEEALGAVRKSAELVGEDQPAFHLRSAWILYHAKRYQEALGEYQRWLARFDSNYTAPDIRETAREARFVLSNLCIYLGQMDDAEEWLEQVLDEFPEDIGAMNDLGYLWADRGKSLGRSLRMIEKAVAAEPDNGAYRDSLGWVLYRLGKYGEAVLELRKAVSTEEPDPVILDHLGDALLRTGDSAGAVDSWQQAAALLETAPDNKQRAQLAAKIRQHQAE